MGCGSSKGATLLIVEPIKQQVDGIRLNAERTEAANAGGHDSNLPPPRPPESTKEELLRDKHDLMTAMDQHALEANSKAGESNNLTGFTVDHLLASTVQVYQSSEVVFSTPSENIGGSGLEPAHGNDATTQSGESSPLDRTSMAVDDEDTPGTPKNLSKTRTTVTVGVVSEGDVQRRIEQFGQQQERDNEIRMEHKRRQQALLEQKIEERRKRKKQTETAAIVSGEAPVKNNDQPPDDDQPPKPFVADAVLEEAPKPAAPFTKKDVLYSEDNITLFRDLESYAVNMDKTYVTFATLMEDLYISDLSDLEKVRILFHWITAQNLNTMEFPSDLSDDSPLGYLKAIKNEEKSYASLFLRLCSAAGLHARLVRGYMKGVGYRPDYKFKDKNDTHRGNWNAVLIDGQWRLIDTHWGARHVTEEDNDEEQEKWRTEYKYDEHYFLTDPDMLINTHFPDEQDWQLLSSPVTLEQFEKSIKQWGLFYKLKLAQSSHQFGLINANEQGFVQIKLKVSPFARSDAKFTAELRPYNRQQNSNIVSEMQKYILHYSTEDEEIFDVYLPHAEKYLLKVFGLSKTFNDDNVFTNLCLYQINCPKLKKSTTACQPPFPVVSASYGPNLSTRDVGVTAVSHFGPIVDCDGNGEAKVIMSINNSGEDLEFSQDLRDSESNVCGGRAVHAVVTTDSEKRLVLYVRVPQNGNYSLILYSNANSQDSDKLASFCYYMVSSQKLDTMVTTEPFPSKANGKLGPIQPAFNNLSFTALSCLPASALGAHWLTTDSSGECSLTFQQTQPLTLIANLSSASAAFQDYVMVLSDISSSTIRIRSPPNTEEGSVLLLEIFAAPSHQTQGIPSVFTAFITCRKPGQQVSPWPQAPSRVWGPVWEKWSALSITSVRFVNSTSAGTSTTSEKSFASPYRSYLGIGDFEIQLDHKLPLQIKPKLTALNDNGEPVRELKNMAIVRKNTNTNTCICLRLPESGMYSLIVFGEEVADDSGQLSPLYYCLIHAEKPSTSTDQMPASFAHWTKSCVELRSPVSCSIKRNEPTTIRVRCGRFSKDASGSISSTPYPKIMLQVDGTTQIEPNAQSYCEYEWKYISAPGDKMLGLLVKINEDDQSMFYFLQFDVID